MTEKTTAKKPKRYFIVNPAGCVHEVERAHAEWRLKMGSGWRMAEEAEISAYLNARVQRADEPIAAPFDP